MKSEIKIKVGSEWKTQTGGEFQRYKKVTFPKAVKFVVDSFKARGIIPVVSYEADYIKITA